MNGFELSLLAIIGLVIGFIGGMVGLVLGVIRFPVIMGVETTISSVAGTNIGVSTLGAIVAAIKHFRDNNFHFRIFLIMAITGAIGSFIGSFFTKSVPDVFLLLLVLSIVGYEAFTLIRSSREKEKESKKIEFRSIKESSIGFGVGFLGGMIGLVLGSIRLPAMIQVLKMEPKVAVGTNLAASAIMGTAGLIGHLINGEVNLQVLGVMGSTAMIGAYIGSRFTGRFKPHTLKKLIGYTLLAVMVFLIIRISQVLNLI